MRRFMLPLLLVAAAACDRASDPTEAGPLASGPAFSEAISQVSQDPTPDQLAVARAVPGFGGYFIDETGAPTVWLTDPSQRPAAEAALAGFLTSFGWTASDLKVRQADYDYVQLDSWYRVAWPKALALPGAVSSDLDEGKNRLRFGGVDAAALASIAQTLTDLGVPSSATVLQLRAPVVRAASLRDRIRPAHGGLQINFFPLPASPLTLVCTIGFNALRGTEQSFITNSHCSNVQGGVDTPTDYYQAERGLIANPANYIAREADDPVYTASAECPLGRQCRYSDASRARYSVGLEFSMGRIARTATLNTAQLEDDPGMLTIDAVNPQYRLVAEQALPIQGQTLNKVGRTTGWTQGTVASTCENVSVTDSQITQLCQSLVSAFVAGGDSGSPVFGLHTDGTAFLAGILWGSSTDLVTGEVQFIFSPLQSIERELGELTTTDPITTCTTKKCAKKVR
ncbi:MAG TPA: hypothetical protein VF746_07770 [Longimicrobium sp.]|jgi:hypothetical protein